MPLDPELLYNIAPSVAGAAATLGAFYIKAWASVSERDGSLSETE